MNLEVTSQPLASVDTDLLVLGLSQDEPLSPAAEALDSEWAGLLGTVKEDGAFKGKAYELEWLYPTPGKARRALLIGTGKASSYDVRVVRRLAAIAARQARAKRARRIAIALPAGGSVSTALLVQSIVDGALTGLVDSDLYKDRENKTGIETLQVVVPESGQEASEALERGRKIATAVNFGRWLGDEPANVMTPIRAAEEARRWAEECGVECQVLGEGELREAGMESLLSVSRGSKLPPQVVVLTYNGGGEGRLAWSARV